MIQISRLGVPCETVASLLKIRLFSAIPMGFDQLFNGLSLLNSMTEGAQQALRRTMEIYSRTTRFALACNDSSKLIEPIQSRCAVLRYTKLTPVQLMARLLQVVKAEDVQYTNEGLEAVVFTAEGDMRQVKFVFPFFVCASH